MNKFTMKTLTLLLCVWTSAVAAADLSINEWEQTRFNELDINKDKALDNVEFRGTTRDWMTKSGYSEEKQITRTNEKFKQYDTNKDNKVSPEEFVTKIRLNKSTTATNKAAESKKQTAKVTAKETANKKSDSLLNIGDIAPNYLGTDKDGIEINVDELKGKIVIVSFWVSWCKPCKNELAILNNLQNQIGSDFIKVVAINNKDNRPSYNKFKKQLSALDLTLTHDKRGTISKKYGVEKAPHFFILGKDGKIIFMDSNYQATPVNAIVDVLKKELSA